MRFGWPERFKPSKAAAKAKDYRPVLQHGWIERVGDDVLLRTTDATMMVEVPLHFMPLMDREKMEFPEQPMPIPRRAMVAAEAERPYEIEIDKDGSISIRSKDDGVTTTFHLASGASEFTPPPFEDIWEKAKCERTFTVGVSPKLLSRLAEALAAPDGVRLTFNLDDPKNAIVVEPMYTVKARGLLMPMRLSE